MRKYIIVMFLIVSSFFLGAEGISLALARIGPIGASPEVATIFQELLQTDFSNFPIFQFVERNLLDEHLAEQEIQLSGIIDTESAVRVGYIVNADKVVFGSLGLYDTEFAKYLLSLRLADVERATVEAAESIEVRSKDYIRNAVVEISSRLSESVKISVRIVKVDDKSVHTTLSSEAGIQSEQLLSVIVVVPILEDRFLGVTQLPVINLLVFGPWLNIIPTIPTYWIGGYENLQQIVAAGFLSALVV